MKRMQLETLRVLMALSALGIIGLVLEAGRRWT